MFPFLVLGRGLGRLARAVWGRWLGLSREQRGPVLLLAAAVGLLLWLVPYGLWLAGGGVLAAAAWSGWGGGRTARELRAARSAADERLAALYEALVPYFSLPSDPSPEPLYAHGGVWQRCFSSVTLSDEGRIAGLCLRYPAFFPDGDAECRARVERLLAAKAGRGREFRFRWDEEGGELEMVAVEPLPTGIGAQRFVAASGEVVLGFTDAGAVDRTVPVRGGAGCAEQVDASPVVWRAGPRTAEPHLLVVGAPGAGATSLLRSVALQALLEGDVLLVDGSGAGEFACFGGRCGVVSVESTPAGGVAALEWAARETERRLLAAGGGAEERALWIVVDRPALLRHLAGVQGLRDPLGSLQVPLRFGRAGRVTVVLAEQFEGLSGLGWAAASCARARVVLGAVTAHQASGVLGAAPPAVPSGQVPPGRGFARLGAGPVYRLQVPATPDPGDESADEGARRAVLALLPGWVGREGSVAGRG
ncbi:hypothetical protein [Streptomyces johnsoniae]|uniref:FtsK domain-containing protein n=1 Tax=Streptomyces johnsoniae TaxID=3075532 RepID=A0ABU2SBY6_9ACTN|nr:hypothetical protein [Streptomyces sp. DSM 41886]MDT0446328.1 hypothetical protein [Streptomyces sp. DSM 41886]